MTFQLREAISFDLLLSQNIHKTQYYSSSVEQAISQAENCKTIN